MSFKRPMTLVSDIEPLAQARGWKVQVRLPGERRFVTGSHALQEDVTALLLHGSEFLQAHYLAKSEPLEAIADYYYGRLYTVSEEQVLPAFSCTIPDARLIGWFGAVVTPENEILTQSTVYGSLPQLRMEAALYGSARGESVPEGRWLSLLSYGSEIYGHWLVDCLPRLMLDFPLDSTLGVIMPPDARPFHYETLALLGIPRERTFAATRRTIYVKNLQLRAAGAGLVRPHIRLVERLVETMRVAVGVEASHQRRLYISRAHQKRGIVNEAELLPILADFGFEIVYPETLSQAEQVRLFSQASVIIGTFGSGILNAIYAKPGALVLEIYNRARWDMHHHRLLTLLGHQHWHCFADNLSAEWDTYLDPKKLERCLTYALAFNA